MSSPRPVGSLRFLLVGLDRFSGLYLCGLFVVVFGLWVPDLFLTSGTVHSVAAQQAIAAIVALAVLVPLAGGTYDLSVGATVNFSTVLVTVLQSNHGWSMWPAVVATVVLGAVIGAVNGLFVVLLRVNSFIATLGTASVIGAFQAITAGQAQPLPPTSSAWTALTQREVLGFQVIVFYLLAIAVVMWWILAQTPVGRYLYAVGGNAEAARLSGVRTGLWTWLSLIISGTLCGLAGVFYASLSGPSLTFGAALLLPAFAAVFLGSTQLTPGRVNVWGTLIALYTLATGTKGLQLVTGVQWLPDMFNGIALLSAVSFAVWRQRSQGRRRTRGRPSTDGETPAAPPALATTSGVDGVGSPEAPAIR